VGLVKTSTVTHVISHQSILSSSEEQEEEEVRREVRPE
jgi:hypothetical protein